MIKHMTRAVSCDLLPDWCTRHIAAMSVSVIPVKRIGCHVRCHFTFTSWVPQARPRRRVMSRKHEQGGPAAAAHPLDDEDRDRANQAGVQGLPFMQQLQRIHDVVDALLGLPQLLAVGVGRPCQRLLGIPGARELGCGTHGHRAG